MNHFAFQNVLEYINLCSYYCVFCNLIIEHIIHIVILQACANENISNKKYTSNWEFKHLSFINTEKGILIGEN